MQWQYHQTYRSRMPSNATFRFSLLWFSFYFAPASLTHISVRYMNIVYALIRRQSKRCCDTHSARIRRIMVPHWKSKTRTKLRASASLTEHSALCYSRCERQRVRFGVTIRCVYFIRLFIYVGVVGALYKWLCSKSFEFAWQSVRAHRTTAWCWSCVSRVLFGSSYFDVLGFIVILRYDFSLYCVSIAHTPRLHRKFRYISSDVETEQSNQNKRHAIYPENWKDFVFSPYDFSASVSRCLKFAKCSSSELRWIHIWRS